MVCGKSTPFSTIYALKKYSMITSRTSDCNIWLASYFYCCNELLLLSSTSFHVFCDRSLRSPLYQCIPQKLLVLLIHYQYFYFCTSQCQMKKDFHCPFCENSTSKTILFLSSPFFRLFHSEKEARKM